MNSIATKLETKLEDILKRGASFIQKHKRQLAPAAGAAALGLLGAGCSTSEATIPTKTVETRQITTTQNIDSIITGYRIPDLTPTNDRFEYLRDTTFEGRECVVIRQYAKNLTGHESTFLDQLANYLGFLSEDPEAKRKLVDMINLNMRAYGFREFPESMVNIIGRDDRSGSRGVGDIRIDPAYGPHPLVRDIASGNFATGDRHLRLNEGKKDREREFLVPIEYLPAIQRFEIVTSIQDTTYSREVPDTSRIRRQGPGSAGVSEEGKAAFGLSAGLSSNSDYSNPYTGAFGLGVGNIGGIMDIWARGQLPRHQSGPEYTVVKKGMTGSTNLTWMPEKSDNLVWLSALLRVGPDGIFGIGPSAGYAWGEDNNTNTSVMQEVHDEVGNSRWKPGRTKPPFTEYKSNVAYGAELSVRVMRQLEIFGSYLTSKDSEKRINVGANIYLGK